MKHIKQLVVAMALVISLIAVFAFAGCGKSATYTFVGSYTPQQTEGAAPLNFELKLYSDGTLEFTPGVKFVLNDSGDIVSDGTATGTWSETDKAITLEVKSADRDNAFDQSYNIEKEGEKYEFDIKLSQMSYIRPHTLTQK